MKKFFCMTAFITAVFIGMSENAVFQTRGRIYTVKSTVATVSSTRDFKDNERQIYTLINNERGRRRLESLSWDDNLARVARDYSRKMARENFFSHYDRSGDDAAARTKSANITGWRKLGENLFYCEGIPDFNEFAVANWMKSSGHRQNILDKSWTATGIGIAESNGRIYITQVFIER